MSYNKNKKGIPIKYSLAFRTWHWLSALVVLGLVATVLLRWTLLAKAQTAELLVEKLASIDILISNDQGIMLVKALRVQLWEWHIILGFTFVALVAFRLLLHFTNSKKRVAFSELDLHHKLVRISYCGVYITFAMMATTGLILYFSKDLGISKEITHNIKELHELVYFYIAFFIPLHIAGVFFADATNEKGLVSSMINGREEEKKN